MTESYTPREFIDKINAENPGTVFDPYGVEGLIIKKQEDSVGADLLAQAEAEVAKEKAKNTPEGQIAELERQVEAMRQWLIQDGTYTPEVVYNIIQELKVVYNEKTQQAGVVGDLYLQSLTSAEHLQLPGSIGGSLNLSSLTSTDHLTLPDSIGGRLILNSLKSAEGLELPDSIGGGLYLHSLKSAEGLELPTSIGGDFYLPNLKSAEGLELPTSIGGDLELRSLTSAERDQLRAQRPDLAGKIYPKD
jgi:hypothetical protein